MSHHWVNYWLRTLADADQTIQIKHGIWRVTNPGSDAARRYRDWDKSSQESATKPAQWALLSASARLASS